MVKITHFSQTLHQKIPQTIALLQNANLVVHPLVTQVTLHGSRGFGGHPRPDSDIDLSLLVKPPNPHHICADLGSLFTQILNLTLEHWRDSVEPDLALVFTLHPCHLRCFQFTQTPASPYAIGGLDCFGIYKVQKGFSDFVLNAGIQSVPDRTLWHAIYDSKALSVDVDFYLGDEILSAEPIQRKPHRSGYFHFALQTT